MATIQNDRDVLLQAATTRVIPIPIPISQVEGLETELDNINTNITNQGTLITSVMNNTKDLSILASRTVFSGSSETITLTAVFKNGLTGTATWSVTAGSATLVPNGNTCTVSGNTVSGSAVTIRATVTVSGINYEAFVTLSKLGALSAQDSVDLNTQVTGQLATGKITGLGALALLNAVDLSTQTVGALNGQTQVTNLGTLAYANSIAANQIGAGTLAAGVIYAGTVNVDKLVGDTITGKNIEGGTTISLQDDSGMSRIFMSAYSPNDTANFSLNGELLVFDSSGLPSFKVSSSGGINGGSLAPRVSVGFSGNFYIYSRDYYSPSIKAMNDLVELRNDNIALRTNDGTYTLTINPARVSIQTNYLNIKPLASNPGGAWDGDLAIIGSELVVKIGGTLYKLTKTPL